MRSSRWLRAAEPLMPDEGNFNLFNNVNLALPASDLQDSSDFGKVLNTIGGPRVMQFGLRLLF